MGIQQIINGILTGAVLSAIALASLPELLRFASEWRIVIYCIIVLVIINFRPTGIFGEYELFTKRKATKSGKGV